MAVKNMTEKKKVKKYPSGPPYLAFLILLSASMKLLALGDGDAPWVGESFNGVPCNGSVARNFGPYDYLIRGNMAVVHKAHFTPRVEQLLGGENAAGPTSDLDYVLKVIPNHHRALNSAQMFHFGEQRNGYEAQNRKGLTGYKLKSPIECYYQRALNFRPHDAISRMLYATLLQRSGKNELALKQYEQSLRDQPGAANIQYNYALLLVDMEQYEEARKLGLHLYTNGFPLPGLKKRLIAAGYWESD